MFMNTAVMSALTILMQQFLELVLNCVVGNVIYCFVANFTD